MVKVGAMETASGKMASVNPKAEINSGLLGKSSYSYQYPKVPACLFCDKKQQQNKTKQTKTKLNINRDIKEHNNNTRIYQYHGLGPLQRPKYPKSELF